MSHPFHRIDQEHDIRKYLHPEMGVFNICAAQAARIDFNDIPEAWQNASIIHLGPIANEMDTVLPKGFSPSLLGTYSTRLDASMGL